MTIIFWIIVFIASLAVLVKSADVFTDNSEKVGLAFKIPSFIVGVTIVSIGTSLPELATSIIAVFRGSTEIVAANAIGSNVANIFLVVGFSAIVARRMSVKRSLINLDLPLLACATALLVFIVWDREINFWEGVIALLGYLVYAVYTISSSRERGNIDHKHKAADLPATRLDRLKVLKNIWNHPVKFKLEPGVIVSMVVSAIFIYFSASYTIESIIQIAGILGIGASVIVMSAMAIGTSLPELAVSINAAKKRKYEIALGNIFGSNIFNALVVISIPAMFSTLKVDEATFLIGLPFIVGATVLYIFSGISRKIYNWEGAMYLLIYALFLMKVFGVV